MGTYKLIQDIEAEDHILGPLSLRQFIFALIAVFCFYMSFLLYTKHAVFVTPIFVLPGLFFAFFALPFGRDQPTEVWALAKLRFLFKPRKRIWDQSGAKEMVTITVPKKIEHVYTNGLDQYEVKSRLDALASTLDTRGWAVKNVNANSYLSYGAAANSDRLFAIEAAPQEVPDDVISPQHDILDERNNPIAQQFNTMINQSEQAHRQELIAQLNSPIPPVPAPAPPSNSQWFMPLAMASTAMPAPAPPIDDPSEAQLSYDLHQRAQTSAQHTPYRNLRTLQAAGQTDAPTGDSAQLQAASQPTSTTVTPHGDPAILSLANNNDLNVATIAREAQKTKDDEAAAGEVVIPLR